MEETKKVPEKGELPPLIDEPVAVLTPLEGGSFQIVDRLIQPGSRAREDRFQLAVLGQFKRGKSTLLNAPLGKEFLAHYVTERGDPENRRVTTRESLDCTPRGFKSQLNTRCDGPIAATKRKRAEAGCVTEKITRPSGIKWRVIAVKARPTRVTG